MVNYTDYTGLRIRNWDIVVDIVTRLWIADRGTVLRLPAAARDSFLLRRVQTLSGTHAASYSTEASICFTVV
jgi:hypothetical protein